MLDPAAVMVVDRAVEPQAVQAEEEPAELRKTQPSDPDEGRARRAVAVDLGAVDLVNLLNLQITVASKRREPVADAPGLVTVWSRREFEAMGYYRLADLAAVTTGYGLAPSQFGELGYETRGQYVSAFENDKHLTLVDGIPVNFARSYKAPIGYELPVFFADRVEFLRGPGSALYGVSAFFGVVHLVSDELDDVGARVRAKASGGTDSERRLMADAAVRTDRASTRVSAAYFGQDASRELLGQGSGDTRFRNWNDESSVFIKADSTLQRGPLRGVGAGMMYLRRRTGLGEFWNGPNSANNDLTWETIIPFVTVERRLSERHDVVLFAFVKGNISTERGAVGLLTSGYPAEDGTQLFSSYSRRTGDIESLTEVRWTFWRQWQLIGGFDYDVRGAMQQGSFNDAIFIPEPGDATVPTAFERVRDSGGLFHTVSSYLQLQARAPALSGFIATLGVRQDYGTTADFSYLQFSPRVGLVQKFTDLFNVKLLYGRALRSPSVKSVGLNEEARQELSSLGGQSSIDDVVAETIDVVEGSVNLSHRLFSVGVAAFYNATRNTLDKGTLTESIDGDDVTVNTFVNRSGLTRAWGLEAEAGLSLDGGLLVKVNGAYAHALDPNDHDFDHVPTGKLNGVIAYTAPSAYPATLAAIGQGVFAFRRGGGRAGNDGGRFLLDANIILPLAGGFSLELQGRNLTGVEAYDPGYVFDGRRLSIPQPGRRFLFTLAWSL